MALQRVLIKQPSARTYASDRPYIKVYKTVGPSFIHSLTSVNVSKPYRQYGEPPGLPSLASLPLHLVPWAKMKKMCPWVEG